MRERALRARPRRRGLPQDRGQRSAIADNVLDRQFQADAPNQKWVRVDVLRDLSMRIHHGELTLISGPSGCGKSTLLSLLSGLQSTDSGQVLALGDELSQMDKRALERFRLRHTGFVSSRRSLHASRCSCRSAIWG